MTQEKEKCPTCKGWGFTLKDCDECGGSGIGEHYMSPNCIKCNGTGVLEVPCKDPQCKGIDREIPPY